MGERKMAINPFDFQTMLLRLCVVCFAISRLEGAVPSDTDIYDAIGLARDDYSNYLNGYNNYVADVDAPPVCPMARWHAQDFPRTYSANITTLELNTMILIDAHRYLIDMYGHTLEELLASNMTDIFHSENAATCAPVPRGMGTHDRTCRDEVWRPITGYCNNLEQNRYWGNSDVLQRRILPSAYEDGFSAPRSKSVIYGENLPNPRRVSNVVHLAGRHPQYSSKLSMHIFQMAMFLSDDMILSPSQSVIQDCCRRPVDSNLCIPIRVLWYLDPNPYFQPEYCMNIHRSHSSFCPDADGHFRRNQYNYMTSFIDASAIYGSYTRTAASVESSDGLLKEIDAPDPFSDGTCNKDRNKNTFSTIQGTSFLNVVPAKTAYHTLFVREHNRLAAMLNSSSEPYQEARRFVIAILQKIVYDEFLPAILPPATLATYELTTASPFVYEPTTNPTLSNEFGIAFRFGHTWIPRYMFHLSSDLYVSSGNSSYSPFVDDFDRFDQTVEGYIKNILNETAPQTDHRIESTARSFLFLDSYLRSYDLAAVNIQRGRDHGIPPYGAYRVHCGFPAITTFSDLTNHSADVVQQLQWVYSDARDIDLFTGIVTETPMDDGEVRPTLACLLGDQFRRLKYGDRYWFEATSCGLTASQISSIKTYSLAKLLCNNFNITHVNYPNALLITDPLTPCDSIPDLSLV